MDEENKLECPVCKHVISDFDEGVSDPCEHVMLTYVDICNGEFVHSSGEGEKIEEELLAKYEYMEENDAPVTLDELMAEYAEEHDGFEVIELTTYGFACGPCSSTEYNLIKTK